MSAYPCRHLTQNTVVFRMDVKLYTEVHLTYKAGFLTYRSSRCLAFSQMGMQWTHETVFPEYSDRIAQDSHLIPSSEAEAPALRTAILNYTLISYYPCRNLSMHFAVFILVFVPPCYRSAQSRTIMRLIHPGACLKNHSHDLHSPFCGIYAPPSVDVARCASLIRDQSPTNCEAHLTESLFQNAL